MITKTLNLVQMVLKHARHLHDMGVNDKANKLFQRLLAITELPREATEEIHVRLGEICYDQGRFRQARRHLSVALAYQPDNAHYHYMIGLAIEADEKCPLERAFKHYRRAVKLGGDHPDHLCALGLTALDLGRPRLGLSALRRAHRLSPDDPALLEKVVEGLGDAGAWDEAKSLVRAMLFRNPDDLDVQRLWRQMQFQALLARQQSENVESQPKRKAGNPPAILPMTRPALPTVLSQLGQRVIRRDGPNDPAGPKQTKKRAGKKNLKRL